MNLTKCTAICAIVLLVACSQNASKANLVEHKVASKTSLAPKNGYRIEIHVNNVNLTKKDCEAIIEAYKKDAGPQGQVGVRKPDKSGKMQPWGVENMDGKGVIYNDFYFE